MHREGLMGGVEGELDCDARRQRLVEAEREFLATDGLHHLGEGLSDVARRLARGRDLQGEANSGEPFSVAGEHRAVAAAVGGAKLGEAHPVQDPALNRPGFSWPLHLRRAAPHHLGRRLDGAPGRVEPDLQKCIRQELSWVNPTRAT